MIKILFVCIIDNIFINIVKNLKNLKLIAIIESWFKTAVTPIWEGHGISLFAVKNHA